MIEQDFQLVKADARETLTDVAGQHVHIHQTGQITHTGMSHVVRLDNMFDTSSILFKHVINGNGGIHKKIT